MKLVSKKDLFGFDYHQPLKLTPDAGSLLYPGTLYLGEPGKPLGVLLEVRLSTGVWAQEPIMSGGIITNVTDKSVFVEVNDHVNLTEFRVNLPQPITPERVGLPVWIDCIVSKEGKTLFEQRFMLGFLGGVNTFHIPRFYAAPETFWNKNQEQDQIAIVNGQSSNVLNAWVVTDGETHFVSLGKLVANETKIFTDEDFRKLVFTDDRNIQVYVFTSAPAQLTHSVHDKLTATAKLLPFPRFL